jgi:hypothetical protein
MERNGSGYGYSCLEYEDYQQVIDGDEYLFLVRVGFFRESEEEVFRMVPFSFFLTTYPRLNSIYYHDGSEHR